MRAGKILWALMCSLLFSTMAWGDTLISIAVKKQQEKRNQGWSLSDWMTTKNAMFQMDRWLALNSSTTPFEFRFRGGQDRYDQEELINGVVEKKTKTRDWGRATINYSIIGISAGYEKNQTGTEDVITSSSETTTADLSLRIFGKSMQDTNITGVYGIKHYSGDRKSQNQYWGGDGTIYLLPMVGATVGYREYLDHCGSDKWCYHGHTVEYGGFIDLSFFRPEVTFFREKHYWDQEGSTPESKEVKGYRFTASLFF